MMRRSLCVVWTRMRMHVYHCGQLNALLFVMSSFFRHGGEINTQNSHCGSHHTADKWYLF